VVNRASAVAEFGDFEALREAGKAIRNRALADLDLWLERFEQRGDRGAAPGAVGRDGAEICRMVTSTSPAATA
jgi:L-lactate dehydrogenase complex protein LldF